MNRHEKTDKQVNEIIDHIDATRNRWTQEERPAHWERWNHVEKLFVEGMIENAIDYATVEANKEGWRPWVELMEMLKEVKK